MDINIERDNKVMKDEYKTIPEYFFDFLSHFIPGYLLFALILYSPLYKELKLSEDVSIGGDVERVLLLVLGGYVIGHALTMITMSLRYIARRFHHEYLTENIQKLHTERKKALTEKLSLDEEDLGKDRSMYDLCEQFVKRHDYAAGLLCQKRHGWVVLNRNMAVICIILLPFYWDLGLVVRISLFFFTAIFLIRWEYLRERRAQFLLDIFHLTSKYGSKRD